jgi:uncharacterized membrane protein YcaP (DUF421 family)
MTLLASQMTENLFTMGISVLEKGIRTLAVYGGLLVLLRLAGKRNLAQLNSFDLVVLLLLSNVVQNAVIGADNSLTGGLLGAAILVSANAVVVRTVSRRKALSALLEGTDTVVARNGQLAHEAVRRLGLSEAEVIAAVRRQGANSMDEVQEATLRPGGTIEVVLEPEDENATKGDVRRLEAKLDRLLGAGGG